MSPSRTVGIFFFASFLLTSIDAVGWQQGSPVVNFGREADRSGGAVAAIETDNDGVMYFGTSRGVVVYDGEVWQEIDLGGKGNTHSITYDSLTDRIYIGGTKYFGYLKRDRTTRFSYVELSTEISETHAFKDVWQIFRFNNNIYFMTPEGRFLYNSDSVTYLNFPESYFFQVGSTVYLSETNGALSIFQNGVLVQTWDQKPYSKTPAFQVLSLDQQHDLILYPQSPPLVRNTQNGSISVYEQPLTSFINEHWLYNAISLSNNLLAIATWADGVFITDEKGQVLRKFTTEDRLMSNEVYEMKKGPQGNLWLATSYGISMIYMTKAFPDTVFERINPFPTQISSFVYNYDSITYTTQKYDTAKLSRPATRIKINFNNPGADYYTPQTYQYRLLNYDTVWHSTTEPMAVFDYLPNGNYVFQVKDGSSNLEPAELVIIVAVPLLAFVKGPLGYAFLAMLVLGLTIIGIIYRAKSMRKTLAMLVAKKTEEVTRHEQQLLRSNRELMAVNEELDTFLYRSSHDLIAPVKSIRGLLYLLKVSKDELPQYLDLMENRILRLENTLLEINSYVKNSKSEPLATNIRLHSLVNEVWADIEFIEHADKLTFKNEVNRDLEIESDPGLWKMIIHNLLINAIKYHDGRKESSFVRVWHTIDNNVFTLKVEDNGQGIASELLPRVYDMFFRANANSKGSGLGLFLVKKMVGKLGGTINIESEYAKGTLVSVSSATLSFKVNEPKMRPKPTTSLL
ncbi:ATP-binding protein [uncultured Imperialibacter sp.]|uniref:sensor histidine kinase n=1 Tax=uncultured Imperialibacter sp. TaxID=1672639 RepID=UPI0030D786D5|tara:strand:- start:12161 stop:14380 length:2220 start_codon:yes stop_codon:yes gene_type:complete